MIKREDPFNDNRCYKSSSMDESNLYAKKFKVSYTSTVRLNSSITRNSYMKGSPMACDSVPGSLSLCS